MIKVQEVYHLKIGRLVDTILIPIIVGHDRSLFRTPKGDVIWLSWLTYSYIKPFKL